VLAVYQKTKSRRRGALLLGIDRGRFAKRLREALGERCSKWGTTSGRFRSCSDTGT
jgi:hypothetical protein